MSRIILKGLAVSLGLFAGLASAKSSQITEIEANNTLSTAQNIDNYFSLSSNDDILNSTTVPHVSILGFGPQGSEAPSFDFYSFTVTTAGLGIFDIDYGRRGDASNGTETLGCPGAGPGCIDPFLKLVDAAGNLIVANDNSPVANGAGGSFSTGDSFISYFFTLVPDTYFIRVSEKGPVPLNSIDSNYLLQVSIENHAVVVPEPATLALFGIGLLGLGAARRQRQST